MKKNMNNDVYTAIVTPMFDDGQIDYKSFENILYCQQAADCGILILGSTGEALALTYEEQCQVVTFVSKLNLSVPILVGVGGFQLPQQLKWVAFCNQQNIDGYLMVTPIYAKPGVVGQTAWFKTLLDQAEKPCMLYNVPSRTGISLCRDVLKTLQSHPYLWALKEASGDTTDFKNYGSASSDVILYSGADEMMPVLAKLGAKGLVSVVSNLWPLEVKKYVASSLNNKITDEVQTLWAEATTGCFQVANPIPTKAWLATQKKISSPALRAPLIAEELDNLEQLVKVDEAIVNYYH